MLRLTFFFCCSLIVLDLRGSSAHSQDNGGTVCTLQDAPTQCGAFCLSALHPLFDHNRKMRNRLAVIEENGKKAITIVDFDERLNEVRDQHTESFKKMQAEIQNQLQRLQTTMERHRSETQKNLAVKLQAGLKEIQTKMQNHEDLQKFKTKVQTILERQSGDFPEAVIETLERVAFNIPPEFEKISNRFFYIEQKTELTWIEAKVKCREIRGYLAAIQNQNEMNAIAAKLRKGSNYWLGINDIKKEGVFESVASGRRAPFLKWREGEPNNTGEDENGVLFINGEMNDACVESKELFICQSDDKI